MARRRFFVDQVRGGHAHIEGDEAHHLTRVLRVEAGQKYEISDGANVYLAAVEAARKNLVTFAIVDSLVSEQPLVRIALFASLVRFERFELLLEKATELGVSRIIPVITDRSEKGLEQAACKRITRWLRIVREASEQSRRATLPHIQDPLALRQAVTDGSPHRFALDEDPAAAPILSALPAQRSNLDEVAIIAGPEGGWSDRERALLSDAGWRAVSLGRTILKTETAVIAALAILNAAWQVPP